MKLFLAGGTGFVGRHVRQALLSKGHTIRLMVHKRRDVFEPGVEACEGDVTRLDNVTDCVAGCEATINLVGIIREFPDSGISFEKLHVEATHNVIEAARRVGVSRHLQMSALGAGPNNTSRYQQSKYRAEELVRESSLDATVFRPSIIFGPEDDFVNKLACLIRSYPAVPVIGDGKYRLQPISVDDVARCFVMALEMPETIGRAFDICGPNRLSYNDMLDTIGRVLGKSRIHKLPSPLCLMKLVVSILQRFSFFPITMDQLLMLIEDNICDENWQKTFMFEPQGFEKGIRNYLGKKQ